MEAGDFTNLHQIPQYVPAVSPEPAGGLISDLKAKINQRDGEIAALKRQAEDAAVRLTKEQRLGEDHKGQIQQYYRQTLDADLKISQLQDEIAQMKSKLAEGSAPTNSDDEIQTLKAALRTVSNELITEKGYHEDLAKRCDQLTKETKVLNHQISATRSEDARRLHLRHQTEFTASSPDGFSIDLALSEDSGMKGFVSSIKNTGDFAIGTHTITIKTAQSYDSVRCVFRKPFEFTPCRMSSAAPIGSGYSSLGFWIIRKDIATAHLLVGNGTFPLKWPPNDHSHVQEWLLFSHCR